VAFQAIDEGSIPFARFTAAHRNPPKRVGTEELRFWSDIYASKQGAQRAAYHLKANVGAAVVEDLVSSEVSA
jgi:hypothetical protein